MGGTYGDHVEVEVEVANRQAVEVLSSMDARLEWDAWEGRWDDLGGIKPERHGRRVSWESCSWLPGMCRWSCRCEGRGRGR